MHAEAARETVEETDQPMEIDETEPYLREMSPSLIAPSSLHPDEKQWETVDELQDLRSLVGVSARISLVLAMTLT